MNLLSPKNSYWFKKIPSITSKINSQNTKSFLFSKYSLEIRYISNYFYKLQIFRQKRNIQPIDSFKNSISNRPLLYLDRSKISSGGRFRLFT